MMAAAAPAAAAVATAAAGAPGRFEVGWEQFAAGISAVGALGMAAFGVTEALGKAFAWSGWRGREHKHFGLPYTGLGIIKTAIRPFDPALTLAYGECYMDIIAQQYRADRSKGAAPDTIRQGVRLGLPFLGATEAAKVIKAVWKMPDADSEALAAALQANPPAEAPAAQPAAAAAAAATTSNPLALAGRFSTALDSRIFAAFDLADERYESLAKMFAGVASVVLAVVFNWGLGSGDDFWFHGKFPLPLAVGIGLVAVPLAPVAKDLSTSLQNALTAFKQIPAKLP